MFIIRALYKLYWAVYLRSEESQVRDSRGRRQYNGTPRRFQISPVDAMDFARESDSRI